MKIMSWEYLALQERLRQEDSDRRGIKPEPRHTFHSMVVDMIRIINQADPNVIEGTCETVEELCPTSTDEP